MCGRFYVDEETQRTAERFARDAERPSRRERAGDVRPSQKALVLTGRKPELCAEEMAWGFPARDRKGLLINARSETVLQRSMFRDGVLHRRCVIPAKHFYEWDPTKNKVSFMRGDSPVLYMAGFYDRFGDEDRFIILTTQANSSVRAVHDRMPLLLEPTELRAWVYDDSFLESALHKPMPELSRFQEYEQQRLF